MADGETELWKHVQARNHAAIRLCLKEDEQKPSDERMVNIPDSQGSTCIFHVAEDGDLLLVQELHRAGANINHRNKANELPITLAIANNRFSTVEYLAKHKSACFGPWEVHKEKMKALQVPMKKIRLMETMLAKHFDADSFLDAKTGEQWEPIDETKSSKVKTVAPSCAWATGGKVREAGVPEEEEVDIGTGGLDEEDEVENINEKWVKLISKEGHEFMVERACCMASGTIRTMLSGPGIWRENTGNKMPSIQFEAISTTVLEKTIQYFHYKKKYDHTPPPLPHFPIEPKHTVEVLLAAHFLDT